MIGQVQPAPEPAKQPPQPAAATPESGADGAAEVPVREIGGREGLEPTRYGDWEKNGRCIDF